MVMVPPSSRTLERLHENTNIKSMLGRCVLNLHCVLFCFIQERMKRELTPEWASCWGSVTSCLLRSSPDRAVLVRSLTHLILTVILSTRVYQWLPADREGGGGGVVTRQWTRLGEVEILHVTETGDIKCRPYGPLGLYPDFTYLLRHRPLNE